MSAAVLSYAEAVAAGPGVVGGKAWTLARLAGWGYPVPVGVVVPAALDEAARQAPRVAPLVAAATRLEAAAVAGPDAAVLLAELHQAIVAAPLPADDLAALETALAAAGLAGVPLAVRSSATGEDGAAHSFAGIHDSVLNVAGGAGEVAAAIRRCQASLWTPRAVAYRRRFSIADADCRCAVLLCRMVCAPGATEPVAAGVAFTADPGTGRRDRLVVEAVAGLGDALVSGRVTPVRHVFALGALGCEEVAPPAASPLPAPAAASLAGLAHRLHWTLGDGDTPQDIEWAYDGARVVVVQARPVTALPRRAFAALAGRPVLWSNANLKEVLAEVPSLLSWSIMQPGISRILFDPHRIAGLEVPDGQRLLRRVDGRPYLNIGTLQWAAWEAFGAPPAEFNRLMGGTQPAIDVPDGRPDPRRLLRLMRALRGLGRRLAPRMDDMVARARQMRHGGLAALSEPGLAGVIRAWTGEILDFPIQLANSAAGAWLGIARGVAAARLPADRADALVSRLMVGMGGVTSADHATALRRLAVLRHQGAPGLDAAWRAFDDAYGHRAFTECELSTPRWHERSADLHALLDSLGALPEPPPGGAPPVAHDADLAALPWLARQVVRLAARKTQAGYALRERTKSCLVAALDVSRQAALEAGRRMAARGLLADAGDVFDLSAFDVMAWLDGAWDGTGAAALAAEGRRRRMAWAAMPAPPDVLIEEDGTLGASASPGTAAADSGRVWRGIAASAGRAEGVARMLADPGQAGRLEPGAILVTRATDPGWTPLFLIAGGVVAETGGYLSHSAIVAREFGLPAVVNVPGVLAAVRDGEMLLVDGDTGMVTALGKTPPPP
ncbi:PEP/pyruvate-binding domain-containing protein [Novispirillum sp. DQ9]|uniref:PEP/pyruvate-binding domain-containing protein n=1 Tax=Novispirillum sp. DQ9 TaxID=3398612 RepID=UPI003C7A3157